MVGRQETCLQKKGTPTHGSHPTTKNVDFESYCNKTASPPSVAMHFQDLGCHYAKPEKIYMTSKGKTLKRKRVPCPQLKLKISFYFIKLQKKETNPLKEVVILLVCCP